ncbi:unnamed protein product, partial [Effrenium voratum]
MELVEGWDAEDLPVELEALLAPAAAYTRLRVALRDVSAGAVAVAEAVLMRQADSQPPAAAPFPAEAAVAASDAVERGCRICMEGPGEARLLEAVCACRGSLRFICRECLALQWAAQPQKGLQCGLCRQAFSGAAHALLLDLTAKRLEEMRQEKGQDVEVLKQQVTTATGLWQQGRLSEAEPLFRAAVAGLQQCDDAKAQLYTAQHNLSLVLVALGRPLEARKELREARRGLAVLYGAEHPLVLKAAHNEAMAANAAGDCEEAHKLYEVTCAVRTRVLGLEHVDTLKTRCNLGLALRSAGRFEEAEAELRCALAGLERKLGPRHQLVFTALQNLGLSLASCAASAASGGLAQRQAGALLAAEAAE